MNWVLKAACPRVNGTHKPEQHRIFDNTQATQFWKQYTYTQANGLLSSILVKRRILIAGSQPTENHTGRRRKTCVLPEHRSELLRRSGFGRSDTSCSSPPMRWRWHHLDPRNRATSPAAVGFDSPLLLVPLCSIPVSNGARSSAAVDFLTPLPLVPLLPGGGGPCPPPSRQRRHLRHLPLSNKRNPPP